MVILGDRKAKAGEYEYPTYSNSKGHFDIGKTNCQGEILFELTEKHKIVISNTLYNHKYSRRTTWHAPNGDIRNQIDYILTLQRLNLSIIKTSSGTYS